MRRFAWAAAPLALMPLLAGCTTLPPCSASAPVPAFAAGDHELAFCVDGQARTAIAVVPPSLATPAPLLLMLHGGGGHADQMRAQYGMDAVAERLGFVVVYADGTPARRDLDLRSWNAMHCCGKAFADRSPDVRFLGGLLDAMLAAWPLDEQRVGVAGHSNGAMMAYRLAAQRSDVVTSVMAVAGTIGGAPTPHDGVRRIPEPEMPVSVLIVHASDDPAVPYEGGLGQDIDGPRVHLPVEEALGFWSEALGAGNLSVEPRGDGVGAGRATGRDGTQLLVLVTAGGHGWPGAIRAGIPAPRVPDASTEIGRFLMATPRVAGAG